MQQVFLDLYIAGIALFVVVSVHSKAMKQNKGETTCQTEEVATPLLNAWRKTSVILFLFFSERDTQLLFLDLLFLELFFDAIFAMPRIPTHACVLNITRQLG